MASLFCLVFFSAVALADRSALEQQLEHRRWTLNDDSPSQIGALAEARDGYLWLGTHDSLYRFDGFDFTRYRTPGGHELGIVSSLLASDAGLWVGLRNGGVHLIGEAVMGRCGPAAVAVAQIQRSGSRGRFAAA